MALTSISWSVIPVELSIGALILFPATRRYGFLLAVVFHTTLCLIENGRDNLVWVGAMMLLLHALGASDQADLKIADLRKKRGYQTSFLVGSLALALYCWLSFRDLELGVLSQALKTFVFLGPLILVTMFAYFRSPLEKPVDFFQPKTWRSSPLSIFAGFLILWAMLPMITRYKTDHVGWAMFSGTSNKKESPLFVFRTDSSRCLNPIVKNKFPKTRFVVRIRPVGEGLEFRSKYQDGLARLRVYVGGKCIDAFPTEILILDGDQAL